MVSERMKKLMGGWKQEKNTKPRRPNVLKSIAASKMTRNQIINLLNRNLMMNKNILKNVEHRMRNLAIQNNKMRKYMELHLSKKN
jgi:hypothetical protein